MAKILRRAISHMGLEQSKFQLITQSSQATTTGRKPGKEIPRKNIVLPEHHSSTLRIPMLFANPIPRNKSNP